MGRAQQLDVPDRILEFLREQNTLTLATVSRTGVPRATTLTYAHEGLNLYVWMSPEATAAKNVEQNPLVAFTIDEYTSNWTKTRGIQGTGECQIILLGDEISHIVELFVQKFPDLDRTPPSNISFFRITPTELQAIDGAEGADQALGLEYHRDVVYSVFRDLPERELETVAASLQTVEIEPGAVIVRQGAPADKFFIIVDGEVEVVREDDGEERTLNVLRRGDFFGEVGILRELPRIATVRAIEATTLLLMDRETFRAVVAGSLGTTEHFDQTIRQRMEEAGKTHT
jgi:nitroimidazol reductase NimA-like FMN-containing flavoprotein (pyridoxamine 5'-phosphate oxidase superfamily)